MTPTNQALSKLARRTQPPPISWLMSLTLERRGLISLAAGFTDNSTLPIKETRLALQKIFRSGRGARQALQYGSTAGDMELREMTAARLRKNDRSALARHYDAKRLLITNGSQQLLYLVTECLCDPGDILLVENPTYFVYLGIAQSLGARCSGVPVTADGIDLGSLRQALDFLRSSGQIRKLKMLVLVSYYQNPTGTETSLERKRMVLELLGEYEAAAGHPIYLLEDAAYRELRFAGDDVPSALSLPGAGVRVIYAGTYSKPFATGIRVGYAVLPEDLFDVVSRLKGNHDFGTSHLLQQIVRQTLRDGQFDRHLEIMRAGYRAKAQIMQEAMAGHFPAEAVWSVPQGGLYFWVRLREDRATGLDSRLFQAALRAGVLYVPGNLCYTGDFGEPIPHHEMRISFGGATRQEIRAGIARLAAVLAKITRDRRKAQGAAAIASKIFKARL